MATIKIKGCGRCSKSKGCGVKKVFRDISSKYDNESQIKYFNHLGELKESYKRFNEFELKCPFADRKYNNGEKVKFTCGIQRYIKLVLWDCDHDCDYCDKENCDDGIVTFENTRYKEYITIEGRIASLIKGDKWLIEVDSSEFLKFKDKLNELDLKFFEQISNTFNNKENIYQQVYDGKMFVSKEKYIKKV